MQLSQRILVAVLALSSLAFAARQEEPSAVAEVDKATLQREADFAALLTGAKLVGFFNQSDKPNAEPQGDSYTLTRVSKADGDAWLFEASIEFGGRDIPIKLRLPVKWAGDTPVISVTDMGFPMLGKYSARVLFYGGQYVGVWSGKDHGGQMWGRVERADKASESAVHWPSFRGPGAGGIGDGPGVATEWDVPAKKNVLWRKPLPGLAHSSPVIWGERMFLTTAVRKDGEQDLKVGLYGDIKPVEDESEFRFELHCLDKTTGETLWSKVAWEGVPSVPRHPKGSHAASTPATDGKRVLAFFGGEGLYCYDLDGELLWKRDLGPMDSGFYLVPGAQWGFGSSPILHNDRVIVQCDVQKGSFVAALDANTGGDVWRTTRDDVPTWSTPTVYIGAERNQVICNGYRHAGGYDLSTGEELWKLVDGGDIPVPTPIIAAGLIFLTNAHGKQAPIYAVDVKASGTLSTDPEEEPFLAWGRSRRGNYMQTPLAYGDHIYFCNDAGIVTCYTLATGEELYRERLGDGRTGFTSSPVAANGNLYYASEEGNVHVVRAGEFNVLSINPLGEECMATPAISAGVIYYRTRGHVVAIGQ